MFILYTTAPMLYRSASSAFYNISLLTSDFYGLLFGVWCHVTSQLFAVGYQHSGLFLFVSLCKVGNRSLRVGSALFPILALFPRIFCRYRWTYRLFLACDA